MGHRLPRFSLSSVKQGQQSVRCRVASRLGKHRAHSAPCALCDILCLVNELRQHFLDAFFLLLTTTFLGVFHQKCPAGEGTGGGWGGGEGAPRPVPRARGNGKMWRSTQASPLPTHASGSLTAHCATIFSLQANFVSNYLLCSWSC